MTARSPSIKNLLSTAAESCALALASGDEPFFKKLEWWLADGVFNHEPFGMFRTDDPYRPGDTRTVGGFLQQETRHHWDGMRHLHDLFCQQVMELLEGWVRQWLVHQAGQRAVDEKEWDRDWAGEWEEALFMVSLHPKADASAWEEFLALPLATVVEGWREHAARVADERALRAARMVSRQAIEAAMVEKVANDFAHQRRQCPGLSVLASLEALLDDPYPSTALELAVFVRSSAFTRRLAGEDLGRIHARFPLPEAWANPDSLARPAAQDH